MTNKRFTLLLGTMLLGLLTLPILAQGPAGWDDFAERHDVDGDGVVTRAELAETMGHFDHLDANGDGSITETDMAALRTRAVIGKLAHQADENDDGTITASEWQILFAERDTNGDGVLNADDRDRTKGPRGPHCDGDCPSPMAGLDTNGDGGLSLAELETAAAKLDTNGDGVLSDDELPRFRRHHRGEWRGNSKHRLLAKVDTDGNGLISRAEWESFTPPRGEAAEHAARFDEFDTNGDGELSADELPHRRHRHGRRH